MRGSKMFPGRFFSAVFMALVIGVVAGPGCRTPSSDEAVLKDVRLQIPEVSSDVARITLDIRDVTHDRTLFLRLEFARGADGRWSITVPFLPRNVDLDFTLRNYNEAGVELFNGTIRQRLTSRTVPPVILEINDAPLAIPRITRISVPLGVPPGGSASVTVEVQGNKGEPLRFRVIPAPDGGEFFPANGQITLADKTGSIVFQYIAPILDHDTTFEHTIEIANSRGTVVQSHFSILVLRRGTVEGARNIEIRTQFHPSILNLTVRRVPNTSDVLWSAVAMDDNPTDPEQLTYEWTFLPDAAADTPAPAFEGQGRSTILRNYAPSISGIVRLRVTDADAGTTTLHWALPPGTFPNAEDLIEHIPNGAGIQ